MAIYRNDLLSNTRVLLRWAFIIDIVFSVFLAVLLAAVLMANEDFSRNITIASAAALTPEQKLFAARVGIAGALLSCLLVLPMLRRLLAIVDSARSGDPFVPENGARLRHIGWLLLVINVAMTIAISLALRGRVSFPPVSFTAVLTVLMVFVIARIFETGSRMRAELQDTV